jgi:hypothetical protein
MLEKGKKFFKHLLKHVPVAVNNIPVQCTECKSRGRNGYDQSR